MITYEEAKKWYTQGIIDADGSIGDGIDADFYDQYGDQFQSPSTEVKGQQPDIESLYDDFMNGYIGKLPVSARAFCHYLKLRDYSSQPQEVGQDELYNKGYADGYRDATNEARKEIHDHYRPNNEH